MADVTLATDEFSSGLIALTASTAKSVQFPRDLSAVRVVNEGANVLWVAISASSQATAATVQGKNCWPVRPRSEATLPVRADGNTHVSLIALTAATAYVAAT